MKKSSFSKMENSKNNVSFSYKNGNIHGAQNQLSAQQNELRLLKHSLVQIMQMKEVSKLFFKAGNIIFFHIFTKLLMNFQFNILKDPLRSSNPMVNTVGLLGIANKFDSYSDCSEFLTDIKLLALSYSNHYACKLFSL